MLRVSEAEYVIHSSRNAYSGNWGKIGYGWPVGLRHREYPGGEKPDQDVGDYAPPGEHNVKHQQLIGTLRAPVSGDDSYVVYDSAVLLGTELRETRSVPHIVDGANYRVFFTVRTYHFQKYEHGEWVMWTQATLDRACVLYENPANGNIYTSTNSYPSGIVRDSFVVSLRGELPFLDVSSQAFSHGFATLALNLICRPQGVICNTKVGVTRAHGTIENLKHLIFKSTLYDQARLEIAEMMGVQLSKVAARMYAEENFNTSNGIAAIRDLIGVVDMCRGSFEGLRSAASKQHSIWKDVSKSRTVREKARQSYQSICKEASNQYLSFHYAYKLNILQITDLIDMLQEDIFVLRFSSRTKTYPSGWTVTGNYAYEYEVLGSLDSELDKLVNTLDLDLSLNTFWDMTTYSFVVDWFVSLGSVLQGLDGFYSMTQKHRCRRIWQSYTATIQLGAEQISGSLTGYDGAVYAREYMRTFLPRLRNPDLLSLLEFSVPGINHFVEGAALVVQRT